MMLLDAIVRDLWDGNLMKPFKAWAVVERGRIACWNYRVPLYWFRKYAVQDAECEGLNTKVVRVKVSIVRQKKKPPK